MGVGTFHMVELKLPDLTFSSVIYGKQETPWDLRPLLYRGASGKPVKKVSDLIDKGTFGLLRSERIELVQKIHEKINGDLVGGGSRQGTYGNIKTLRYFFQWADATDNELSLDTVENTFKLWADQLQYRERILRDISTDTAYGTARKVGSLLDAVLDRHISLISETRISKPWHLKGALATKADKQNLEEAFRFGHFLLDVCSSLSVTAIWGPVPLKILLRSGESFEEWSGVKNRQIAHTFHSQRDENRSKDRREAWDTDLTFRTRYPLINFRIEAEILIFISQTGMNLAQVHNIKNGQFHFSSYSGGYQVRRYKERRNGEVEFYIYEEYKKFFERYLEWRAAIFPENSEELLFPLIRTRGRSLDAVPKLHKVQKVCKALNIRFVAPRALRNTRTNWLLRRSQDPDLTAEMAQHTKETLLRTYATPNLQVAMVEINRFHNQTDPAISAPGPGWCISTIPSAIHDVSSENPKPDCVNAAGCLNCKQHRDINSADHVWSLASFRYLKSLELANYCQPIPNNLAPLKQPAAATIDRLTAKIKFFEDSGSVGQNWVREALALVNEGNYHPAWDGFIQLQEFRP